MSLDKSIQSGKEHRKFWYHDSRDEYHSCRAHRGCSYCEQSRLRYRKIADMNMAEQFREWLNSDEAQQAIDDLHNHKPESTDLDPLTVEERKGRCYCKEEGQTHCGEGGCCRCGNPGHLRPLMMCTLVFCDSCYRDAVQEMNDDWVDEFDEW